MHFCYKGDRYMVDKVHALYDCHSIHVGGIKGIRLFVAKLTMSY